MIGSRRLGWPPAAVALLLALSLAYGLMRFGAAEIECRYLLFLMLLAPVAIALATQPLGLWAEPKRILLPVLGLITLGQVAFRPVLTGRGWTHLAIGWMALFLTLWLVGQKSSWVRFLLLVLIVLGGIEAIYGLIQSIGGVDFIGSYYRSRGSVATGTLINRNHFAFTLTMILPLALGTLYTRYERRRQARESRSESAAQIWIVLLSCSFMGIGVLLSQSRGGTVSLVATLLFVVLLMTLRAKSSGRRGQGAMAWILLATVLGLGAAIGIEALIERFGEIDDNLARIDVYRDTLRLIGDHPIVGIGPGMYIWRFRPYQTTDGARLYDHAHNDYLESGAEWGLPIAFLVWGYVVWRFLRTSRYFLVSRSTRRQGLALGCAAAMFSVLLHSLVDFSLQLPALLMMFSIVVGLAWSLDLNGSRPRIVAVSAESREPARMTARLTDGVLRLLLIVLLAVAGWAVAKQLRALSSSAPIYGVGGLERAVEIAPQSPESRFLLGLAYRDLPGVGSPVDAVEQLWMATRLNPFSWRYRMELSRALELAGDIDAAEVSLTEAVRLNPISGEYRWRLANLQLRRGDLDGAVEEIGRSIELDPGLRGPALALLAKSGADLSAVVAAWPDDRESRVALLQALSTAGGLEGSETADLLETEWLHLSTFERPPSVVEARSYISRLIQQGETELARQRWADLQALNGRSDLAFARGDNRIWNGSFEYDFSGAPLGWQIRATQGVTIDAVDDESRGPALQITFDGSENMSFNHVRQIAVVESASSYVLGYSIRSQGISTDQGLVVELIAGDRGPVLYRGPMQLGDGDWRTHQGRFEVAADTTTVTVRLRRQKSDQIDNKIEGIVWLTDFRLVGDEP